MSKDIEIAEKVGKWFFAHWIGVPDSYPVPELIRHLENKNPTNVITLSNTATYVLPEIREFEGDLTCIPADLGGVPKKLVEKHPDLYEEIPPTNLPFVKGWLDKASLELRVIGNQGSVIFIHNPRYGAVLEIDVEIDLSSGFILKNKPDVLDFAFCIIRPKVHVLNKSDSKLESRVRALIHARCQDCIDKLSTHRQDREKRIMELTHALTGNTGAL